MIDRNGLGEEKDPKTRPKALAEGRAYQPTHPPLLIVVPGPPNSVLGPRVPTIPKTIPTAQKMGGQACWPGSYVFIHTSLPVYRSSLSCYILCILVNIWLTVNRRHSTLTFTTTLLAAGYQASRMLNMILSYLRPHYILQIPCWAFQNFWATQFCVLGRLQR